MSEPDSQLINGNTFANALRSGIHRVIGQQEYLNRINVFPVADSDTGTNLSLSLSSALPVLAGEWDKRLGTLLAATADALLDGARGNSGAIIAQFFQGLSDSAGDLAEFSPESFSAAVNAGAEYARDALSQPLEGTVLSATAAFAKSLNDQLTESPARDFRVRVTTARHAVDEAVEKTPTQLDVLRKAGVVDAGAKGFAELIGGFADYIDTGEQTPLPDTAVLLETPPVVEFSAADNTSKYRYCTECLVSNEEIDRRKLREALTELGDSLILAGTKRKAKIHIHSDDPDAIFVLASQFGELSCEKADDMHRQQSSTHMGTQKFAVITDSGADISDADMERLDIHMVPCRIQFGDRSYMDKVSITTDEFYAELKNNPHHPTTSRPSPGDFRRHFQFLASHFSDVISINLTSVASGTYEGARSAAARTNAPGKIHVVDSRNASVGQGQLVVLAAELAALGHSVEETLQAIRDHIPKTKTFAILYDLRYAVRGGRLPKWLRFMADLMHMTPIIRIKPNGKIGLGGCWMGRRNRAKRLARFVARYYAEEAAVQISVGHASCIEDAKILADELGSVIPHSRDVNICDLGTAIGVHGGPGTLIVSIRPFESVHGVPSGDGVPGGDN